jgi:hypothetical protein
MKDSFLSDFTTTCAGSVSILGRLVRAQNVPRRFRICEDALYKMDKGEIRQRVVFRGRLATNFTPRRQLFS